jgi:hypothetical protein
LPVRAKPRKRRVQLEAGMYQVAVSSIEEYFAFDPGRENDLRRVDVVIRAGAPRLKRWFVAGAANGQPGMRMTMIGYGAFHYAVKASAEPVQWPVIGLALQKNYLSLYCSARSGDDPFVLGYADQLGDVDLSATGVVRFRHAEAINFDGLHRIMEDLDNGLTSRTVTLEYRSTTRTRPLRDDI